MTDLGGWSIECPHCDVDVRVEADADAPGVYRATVRHEPGCAQVLATRRMRRNRRERYRRAARAEDAS